MMSAYAGSKSAVEAMANSWRIELAAHGVAVGVLHAGWVRTPLVSEGALHPGFVRLRTTQAHKGEVAQESPRWFQKRLRQRALARSVWANGQLANGLGVALPRNMQPQSLKMLTNAITPTIDKVNIISVVVSSICQNKQVRKKKN
jgi:NAD(P)-dependent dehydrogenase (short-subunit alcohol dehydrogenase family)